MKVKWAGSRKKAVWLTVLRSIKSCMPGPDGSTLSTRSLNRVKLGKPFAWSRDRKRAWSRPIRCGSSVMPIRLRRNATMGAKSSSDHGSGSGAGIGVGSESGVGTSESLAVLRPQGREHAVNVEYEQE